MLLIKCANNADAAQGLGISLIFQENFINDAFSLLQLAYKAYNELGNQFLLEESLFFSTKYCSY